jgi:hypothetical protein
MPKKHRPFKPQTCKCGQDMVRCWRSNSGTTEATQVCPEILKHYGPANWDPWDYLPGHQFVLTTKFDHDPRCCSIREVLGK